MTQRGALPLMRPDRSAYFAEGVAGVAGPVALAGVAGVVRCVSPFDFAERPSTLFCALV